MNVHYVKQFEMKKGFTTLIFACGENKRHPEWAFMSSTRIDDVTCIACFQAIHKG